MNRFQRRLAVALASFALVGSMPVSLALADEAANAAAQPATTLQAETSEQPGAMTEPAANTGNAQTGAADSPTTGSAGVAGDSEGTEIPLDDGVEDSAAPTTYKITEFAALHSSDLAEGNYTFVSAKDSNRVFDVSGGSTKAGAAAQIYSSNQTDAQVWSVTFDEDGFATIKSVKSGKVLDCLYGSSANGTKLQLWDSNGSAAQKWVIAKVGDNYVLVSALSANVTVAEDGSLSDCKVIDLPGGSTSNGTRLQLYSSNNTSAQLWVPTAAKASRERLDELAAQYASEVADGTYAVVSAAGSRSVLDVSGGSKADGGNAQAWRSNASGAQRWVVSHDASGYLTLTNAGSGKALDVSGGRASSGANVQQWSANGSRAQKWVAVPSASGGYELVSALDPTLALDLSGGSASDGTNAQLWSRNGTRAQRWSLALASVDVAPCDRLESLEGGWLELSPACAAGGALDVSAGSAANGANVQVWSSNGSLAQAWQLEWADGWYRLYNAASGKCLDAASGDCVPGANAQQWAGGGSNANQLFSVADNGDGTYTLTNKATGLALDVSGASSADGANVDLWSPNGSSAQRWSLSVVEPAPSEGCYSLSAALSSSVALDVSGGSRSSGANVQSYASNGSWAQRWYLGRNGDGTWFLECMGSAMRLAADASGNVCQRAADASDASQRWEVAAARGGWRLESAAHPGKVLDVSGGSASSGANVQVYAANGTAAQAWRLSSASDQPSGGTYYVCAAADPGKVLDVSGGSSADGANVQLYANNGTGAQKWVLSRQSDGTYSVTNAMTRKALDVANGSASAGANVRQWSSNGTPAQRWRVSYRPGGLRLESALGGSLALASSGTSSGSNVALAESSSENQAFLLKSTTYTRPLTAKQQLVRSVAQSTPTTPAGYCAGWITRVFNRVGGYSDSDGNACDMYWNYCTSSDLSELEVGMIIAVPSHPHTSAGSRYGHVCIYLGDGQVIDSTGQVRTRSLVEWVSYYGATRTPKWGWYQNKSLV